MSERPEFGSEAWFAAQAAREARDFDKLRRALWGLRTVLASLDIRLVGVVLDDTHGRATRKVYSMLEERDVRSLTIVIPSAVSDRSADLIGIVDELELTRKVERRR